MNTLTKTTGVLVVEKRKQHYECEKESHSKVIVFLHNVCLSADYERVPDTTYNVDVFSVAVFFSRLDFDGRKGQQ